jgi:twinkle protein
MLIKHGPPDLAWYIENAEPYPLKACLRFRREDVLRLYEQGFERGHRTGWRELDKLYTVRPGEFTAVTGIPSSGKSNWLDCLLVNLAKLHDWNFAVFSPENLTLEQHMAAIAEKYAGKPFHDGARQRMSAPELEPRCDGPMTTLPGLCRVAKMIGPLKRFSPPRRSCAYAVGFAVLSSIPGTNLKRSARAA